MYTKKIGLSPEQIPAGWHDHLVENQLVGGVFLVFLEGRDQKEIAEKTKLLKVFCKSLSKISKKTGNAGSF